MNLDPLTKLVVLGYCDAVVWTGSEGDRGEIEWSDLVTAHPFTRNALRSIVADVRRFLTACEEAGVLWTDTPPMRIGAMFFYTVAEHGRGFWDSDHAGWCAANEVCRAFPRPEYYIYRHRVYRVGKE